jgi:integrating conjugative element protein (TIGR03746 family)
MIFGLWVGHGIDGEKEMSPYIDKRINDRRIHQVSILALISVLIISIFGMYLTSRAPHRIDVHLKPNIRGNTVVEVVDGESSVPKPNVYGFAYIVWQTLNIWSSNGSVDYGKRIFEMQAYLTPGCYAHLNRDLNIKSKPKNAGDIDELNQRTRFMSEVLGGGYSEARVVSEGNMSWTVYLDVQLTESMRGQVVKDVALRYPMRVVRYDVDTNLNPWKLALDCSLATQPERLASVVVDGKTLIPRLPNSAASSASVSVLPNVVGLKPMSKPMPNKAPGVEPIKGVQP